MKNKHEPYWARYVPSWRKPKPYKPLDRVLTIDLKHCAACSRSCDYYMYNEHDRSIYCPYYNLQ